MTYPPRVLPFDTVEIELQNGRTVRYSAGRFMEIPLRERIRLIFDRRIRFLRDGRVLETKATLEKLNDRVDSL